MIRRAGLVAGLAVVAGLALAPPASAQLTCPDLEVVTAPGTPVTVPAPTCTGAMGPVIFNLIAPMPVQGAVAPAAPPWTYTPNPGFHGVDSFGYSGFDGGVLPSDAKVDVLVDRAPTCRPASVTVTANTSLVLPDVDCTDPDVGDTVGILVGDPTNGTVVFPMNGTAVYTPRPGFVGTDSLLFAGEDQFGLVGPDATMTITVTAPAAATPAPTPVPTPVAPIVDRTAPTVTLKAKKATYAKGIPLTVSVNEGAKAVLTISLDARNAKKYKLSRSIGTLSSTLTAGNKNVTLKLSSKARKAFKKLRQMKVTVTAVVTDAAGNKTTKTLKVTLKAK